MYEQLKAKIESAGEVMARMDSGEVHEFHLHNITFHDNDQLIEVDTGTERYWINGTKVESYWIHKDF